MPKNAHLSEASDAKKPWGAPQMVLIKARDAEIAAGAAADAGIDFS